MWKIWVATRKKQLTGRTQLTTSHPERPNKIEIVITLLKFVNVKKQKNVNGINYIGNADYLLVFKSSTRLVGQSREIVQ